MKAELFLEGKWIATLAPDVAMAIQMGDIVRIEDRRGMAPGSDPEIVVVELVRRTVDLTRPRIEMHCERVETVMAARAISHMESEHD